MTPLGQTAPMLARTILVILGWCIATLGSEVDLHQLACRRRSETGIPTMFDRPITTASLPSIVTPRRQTSVGTPSKAVS
eukprot:29144-Eustigmatos_ZCMA.PRE.1